jgi:hypothetical protein
MVVALVALFVALGGSALAGVIIASNNQIARNTISGHHPPSGSHPNIIRGSVSGTDLSSDLKSSLKLHCPSDMQQAADICFEPALRTSATFGDALQTCASVGLRLPTLAELALAFDHLGAPQPSQWVSTQYFDQSASATSVLAGLLGEDGSRNFQFGTDSASVHTQPYRCVTSATN